MDVPTLTMQLALGFSHWLTYQTSIAAETVVNRLAEQSPCTVLGMEGAILDLGLLGTEGPLPQANKITVLRELTAAAESGGKVIAGLDTKCARFYHDRKYSRRHTHDKTPRLVLPLLTTTCKLTQAQSKGCLAILLLSPHRPSEVHVIPTRYMGPGPTFKKHQMVSKTWPVLPGSLPPLLEVTPPQWSPFAMPISSLLMAWDEQAEFIRGARTNLRNPHNGIEFPGTRPDELQPIETLHPAPQNFNRDSWWIDDIVEASERHGSSRFQAFHLRTKPLLGDFGIWDKETGERMTIELKIRMALLSEDGILYCYYRHDPDSAATTNTGWQQLSRRFFSTMRLVDAYLFKQTPARGTGDQRWIFVHRDELPDSFFNGLEDDRELSQCAWKPDDTEFWELCTINCNPAEGRKFAAQLEKILVRFTTGGRSLKTRRQRPYLPLERCVAGGLKPDHPATQSLAHVRYESCTFDLKTLRAYEVARIAKECQIRGPDYRVMCTGASLSPEHLITPVPAPNFASLPIQAPLILIEFLPVYLSGTLMPTSSFGISTTKMLRRLSLSTQRKPIFVLVPCVPGQPFLNRQLSPTFPSTVRYIVPYHELRCERVVRPHTKFRDGHNRPSHESDIELTLRNGKLIDQFAVTVGDDADLLMRLLRPESDDTTMRHTTVRLSELIINKADIVKGILHAADEAISITKDRYGYGTRGQRVRGP
ncbi:hypothetical protein EDD37DRAFT_628506 [Exophiala viscosa]|uniref:uncharacterized protein n=1 Tax=Exophiala viscosa TaxID=2486360 RepID=UPI00219A8FF0|nr:hypothetical protein EDD37DRAFT_628506 [Exophiala viscosa]